MITNKTRFKFAKFVCDNGLFGFFARGLPRRFHRLAMTDKAHFEFVKLIMINLNLQSLARTDKSAFTKTKTFFSKKAKIKNTII